MTAPEHAAGRPPRRSPRTVIAALLVLGALALLFGVVGVLHPNQGGGVPTGAPVLPTTSPPPLAPVPAGPVLDAPGRQACDGLAYWLADKGSAEWQRVPADVWTALALGYRAEVAGTGNGLLRDSADVLARVADDGPGARELALDTAVGRCEGAGWTAP